MTHKRLFPALALAALLQLPLPLASATVSATVSATASPPATPPALVSAPADDPKCQIDRETYRNLPLETVRLVQDGLAYFGLYANRIDNIVGIDTRAGLVTYCHNRGMSVGRDAASRQALIDELLRDSAIDRVYHGWRDIIGSKAFPPWVAAQKDRTEIPGQLKSGTPAQAIDIIDRFLKYRPEPAKPARNRWPDDQGISYQLTGDDFKALETRQEALGKLVKMKNAGFQEQEAFTAQVNDLLKGDAAPWLELTQQYAETMSVFTLGPQGMARLKAARLPQYLLERLGEFEDPGYPSQTEVEKALREISADIAQELKDYRGQPRPIGSGQKGGAGPEQASAGSNGLTDEISLRLGNIATADAKQRATALEQVSQDIREETGKWLPLIFAQMEESTAYRLSDGPWAKLTTAAGAIPAYVPAMLQNMRDVDYPIRSLFLAAVKARINAALAEYSRSIQGEVTGQALARLDEKFLATLKSNKVPAELVNRLAALKDKEFPSFRELDAEIAAIFKAQAEAIPNYQEFVANQARKKHVPDEAKAIQWAPKPDCKCLPKKMNDIVYGFYPFWLAGQPQTVDFSTLNRIGYYALGFDDSGAIQTTAQWNANSSNIIDLARKYRTQVDLVVSKNDWSAWAAQSREKRRAAFTALAANIQGLLDIKPTGLLSRSKPYVTLGADQPTLGNGVTLFFEHYPEDQEFIEDFERFMVQLRDKLAGNGHFVNLMLPGEAFGQGIFNASKLLDWAHTYGAKTENGELINNRLLILVLLQEPTTDDKKALRRRVEESLKGAQRRNLMRMMVPIIVPDGHSNIDDDVIYMGDNFGGIGFWPLPSGPESEANSEILKTEYYPRSTNQTSAVCGIVCPNRWAFRLTFDFFLVASLACLVAFLSCCECRGTFRRHFLWFLAGTVVPLVILGMALLYCDPALEKVAEGNSLLFLVLLAIIAYAIWDYQEKKRRIP